MLLTCCVLLVAHLPMLSTADLKKLTDWLLIAVHWLAADVVATVLAPFGRTLIGPALGPPFSPATRKQLFIKSITLMLGCSTFSITYLQAVHLPCSMQGSSPAAVYVAGLHSGMPALYHALGPTGPLHFADVHRFRLLQIEILVNDAVQRFMQSLDQTEAQSQGLLTPSTCHDVAANKDAPQRTTKHS
jgi:hypothetical protein